ncbi:MAG: DUF6519 domain-containing protein [Desulfobacterales bacterium]|nr:DUF6519 domain-containing protein [Desulfobacterales bacterium]
MKTQISRNAFKPQKRYAGVYQQQGRMITDADWNNLVDLLKGHLAEALKDVVGTGSPRNGALTITSNRMIRPGDLYVNGLRAELLGTDPIGADNQPDYPNHPNLPATGPYTVYADLWERSLTALEDPDLRDAGLNGADTCTRTQAMLQIKTCAPGVDPEKDILRRGNAVLTLELHGNRESGDPCDPCAGQVDAGEGRIGNYLFRLEVHAVMGPADAPTGLTLKWSSENGAEQYAAESEDRMPPGFVMSGRYIYEFFNLASEKHAGVHLTPGFNPTPGALKPAYEIPETGTDEPRDHVRRWDGYCRLTRSGPGWSLVEGFDMGVPLSTEVPDTAPGHITPGPNVKINLEALELKLETAGRAFVAGDFWLAPVREAAHNPGNKVLDAARPEGIVHHYLSLAQVAADGTVQAVANGADRRRKSFPPLTNLWASDVDYQTDCSGGLFQNFAGTVKDALDHICTIQAKDVGFPKPCDTSIYEGQTIETVEQALKLLCDVQARQISYQPRPDCTYLDRPEIATVQDALDELCRRPAGGGCKITVGDGGQFRTLEETLKTLFSQNATDICICLLPGDHIFGGTWETKSEHFSLSITGCGASTKVKLERPLAFIGLASLKLENFTIDAMRPDLPMTVTRCTAVDIRNLHHMGLAQKNPLIQVAGGDRVRLEANILEAYTAIGLEKPQAVLEFDSELVSLYALAQRDDFWVPAAAKADRWAQLRQNERRLLAGRIESQLKEVRITVNEDLAYRHLVETLARETIDSEALLNRLRDVRDQAHHAAAGRGVIFMDALASVALEDNTIFGSVGFYGLPGGTDLSPSEIDEIAGDFKPPVQIRFLSSGANLQAWDNRITRLTVSEDIIKTLRDMIQNSEGETLIQGLYRTALFESNIIAGNDNQILFENLTLAANEFQALKDPIGWGVGKTVIGTGNRVRRDQYVDLSADRFTVGGGEMLTAARNRGLAANLPEDSWK